MADTTKPDLSDPSQARALIRDGGWDSPTAKLAPGYAQANLAILPAEFAADFARFCALNPRSCPVLEQLAPGEYRPRMAPQADLRTDLPRYRVFRDGQLNAELSDITDLWRLDLTAFLIGCSFTFDWALIAAGLPVRHQQLGCNVPMYRTNRPTLGVGRFQGPLVVSMRPLPADQVDLAAEISGRYTTMHGAPVHAGEPLELGITDLARPDYGDPVPVEAGEVPVFWACGVTPQAVALEARLPLMITHAPGHMFITDLRHQDVLDQALSR